MERTGAAAAAATGFLTSLHLLNTSLLLAKFVEGQPRFLKACFVCVKTHAVTSVLDLGIIYLSGVVIYYFRHFE